MRVPFFDYKRQLKTIKKPVDAAIKRVFDSGKLILGDEGKRLEIGFSRYIGIKYGIGVNSGTDALKIALRAIGIGAGDEVITVANTAVPTISAIRETGAMPVFVDIKDNYLIDETKIFRAITKNTKVILSVHLYGQPCNMAAISKIAKKYGLKVVEDCAQAAGANIRNKKVGTFGDISCFSFYPTKNLGAYGDAGMILTADKKLAQKCRMLRFYGMDKTYYANFEGYNSRLDEIQAAMLNTKLKQLNQWNRKRREIAHYYLKNIKNKKIILPPVKNLTEHAFHLFVIRINNREGLIKYLDKVGIGYGIHYPQPVHLQRAYKFLGYSKGDLPVTEKFANQVLSLPIFPEMTKAELKYIVDKLNIF